MKSTQLRQKYIEFFTKRGHKEIPSANLVPENDPTTLFTSSGMQPLIPYLLGAKHPLGTRLVNSQKSFRSQDIDEVGDNRHTTFFEMLGNWSLGDYFKSEQLPWIFEFLTKELGLDPEKLYVSVFEGNESVPMDTDSISIWKKIFKTAGIDAKEGERIFIYPAKKNWWSRSGEPANMPPGEPGGPDSEVFYDFGIVHNPAFGKVCHPNCDCGRFMEIANSVFMQYKKLDDGSLDELSQKNVDFGGGLERQLAAVNNDPDVFKTDFFAPLLGILEEVSGKKYADSTEITRSMRIIADHIRASVMMMADGVMPSNKAQGYILRRLIRRSLLHGKKLGLSKDLTYIGKLVAPVVAVYAQAFPAVVEKSAEITTLLQEEALRFGRTLEKGMSEIEKIEMLNGKNAFILYETYGFPWEMTVEVATEKGQVVDRSQFEEEFKKHQDLSRTAAKGMFKGGLADGSVRTTKLHTAHHLLLASLQKLIDPSIKQRGSNITKERLRIDVSLQRKLSPKDIMTIEELVNKKISEHLEVLNVAMDKKEAENIGAQMEFGQKYPNRVSVYFIGDPKNYFSAEFCGGPHVKNTGEIGVFKIMKEESSGSGIRRIYATVT